MDGSQMALDEHLDTPRGGAEVSINLKDLYTVEKIHGKPVHHVLKARMSPLSIKEPGPLK